MRVNTIAKHLVGGISVYLIVAACAGSKSDHSSSEFGRGGQGGGVFDVFVDPVPDATATEDACASCTINGTINVRAADSDPAQLVSGTADPAFCVMDSTTSTAVELATGPLVLTDVQLLEPGNTIVYTVAAADPCSEPIALPQGAEWIVQLIIPSTNTNTQVIPGIHGARIPVPSGRKLCARQPTCGSLSPGRIFWSGFRPYEG